MARRIALLVVALVLAAGPALPPAAAQGELTLEALYHPKERRDWNGTLPELRWLAGGDGYLEIRRAEDGDGEELYEWRRVELASGRSRPFYDPARLETAIAAAVAGLGADRARAAARQGSYELAPADDAFLLELADDLFLYRIEDGALVRLTASPAPETLARFDPTGRRVAFVRDNDLYVVDADGRNERRLTTDGGADRLNGILDWVYQEEIYGRGNWKGYWWSPDGGRIAFLQLDERDVPRYTIVDHIPTRPVLEVYPYPKAGDPNPRVRLGVVDAGGGAVRWVDLERYGTADILVVRVGWTPDGRHVVFQVQDREQTWLDLGLADPETGSVRTLFRETSPAWVDVTGDPFWLGDGSFLWRSERSGFAHLYRFDANGTLRAPLTSGEWEVRELFGVDEEAGWAYFSATRDNPIGLDVYRVRLEGGDPQRLTSEAGTHAASFSPTYAHFADRWSGVATPPRLELREATGRPVRTIAAAAIPGLDELRLGTPELFQIETRDGFAMEAFFLKPADFDAARTYPVFCWVYGGPHAPQVRDRWGGTTAMWYQYLAQRGVLVFVVDNRIASGKGARSTWQVYRNFGELELRDLEDAVDWLRRQPYVDGDRIGLGGWSFGGFMTSYALTHSRSFRMGIAGGSVTDWRDYDTIYTERYMQTPQNNPEGYRKSSVVAAAESLHGELLLIHGTMDDNVHVQNTLQLAYALQRAGKPFRLMLYPKSRHGVREPELVYHMRRTMTAFILETLGGKAKAETID